MYDPTDAVTARALLEDALSWETNPALDYDQMDRALALAESLDTDGITVLYTAASLNRAAAWGWNIKAGLTSAQYDLGGQGGSNLTRSQWHDHCVGMARMYATGEMSVAGTSTARGGLRSIGVTTVVGNSHWNGLV